jgi:hypothetical protein
MTIGQYLNKNHPDFRKWGILAKFYSILFRITGQWKWADKNLEYLDKRWAVMMEELTK